MPAVANLVHQSSTSTGTGSFTLDAVNGKQSFAQAFGVGGTPNRFDYFISSQDAPQWERGTGHMSSATTLVRDTVLEGTNGTNPVNFSDGAKDIINDIPAGKQVNRDGLAAVAFSGDYGDLSGTPDFVDVAEQTHAATSKAAPDDSDELPLVDSAASNVLKKLTWANLKATLKTYFDTLYQGVLGFTPREKLTAARTYYVLTTGSDSNTGLANTSGGAFLTIQKAIDTVGSLDLSIYNVTIQVGAGTYTQNLVFKTLVGAGSATLQGDTTTPSNVVLSPASGACLSVKDITGLWNITGFKTNTAGGGLHLYVSNAYLGIGVMDYGAAPGGAIHIYGGTAGVINQLASATTISGSSFGYHIYLENNAVFYGNSARATSLTGNPTFYSYVFVTTGANLRNGDETFSGSVTSGKKYEVVQNGTATGPSGGYPGPTAGTNSTGGQYV